MHAEDDRTCMHMGIQGLPFRSERPKFRYFFPFSLLTGKRISVRKIGDFGFKFKNMKVKLWSKNEIQNNKNEIANPGGTACGTELTARAITATATWEPGAAGTRCDRGKGMSSVRLLNVLARGRRFLWACLEPTRAFYSPVHTRISIHPSIHPSNPTAQVHPLPHNPTGLCIVVNLMTTTEAPPPPFHRP